MSHRRQVNKKRTWEENFEALVAMKEAQGGSLKMPEHTEDKTLKRWVSKLREKSEREKLTEEQVQKLLDLGFDFDPYTTIWNAKYEMLREYKEKHNSVIVPLVSQPGPERELAKWVYRQRENLRRGLLSQERKEQLDQLGFNWAPRGEAMQYTKTTSDAPVDDQWMAMYQKLIQYKAKYSDCNVPKYWKEDQPLSRWVARQRFLNNRKELRKSQIELLNKIGFVFSMKVKNEQDWNQWALQVKEYQKANKDQAFSVSEFVADRAEEFQRWVRLNHRAQREGRLDPKRKERLDEIGFFEWENTGAASNNATSSSTPSKSSSQAKLMPTFVAMCNALDESTDNTQELRRKVKELMEEIADEAQEQSMLNSFGEETNHYSNNNKRRKTG